MCLWMTNICMQGRPYTAGYLSQETSRSKKTMQAKGWKLYDSEDIARIYETQDTTTKEKENGIQTSKING